MAHGRHAALDQKGDGLGHAAAALELDRSAAGLLHHPRGRHEGLLLGRFVGAERHIDDDESSLRPAHHRESLQDHHIEGDRYRRFEPVHHHAERVTDQNEIAVAIKQARRMRVIGREADDRLTALAGADVGGGQPLDFLLCRHCRRS